MLGTDAVLKHFGRSSLALTQMLENNVPLGLVEHLLIENHLQLIQLALSAWNRRNFSGQELKQASTGLQKTLFT